MMPQIPTASEGKTNDNASEGVAAPAASSSWKRLNNNSSSSNFLPNNSFLLHNNSKLEESDEDLFTVPDVEATPTTHSSETNTNANHKDSDSQRQTGFPGKRRRGRNPVDKEYRRHKRLLRNRVSAQQARERKKVYVNDLESRATELQERNSKLEESISTLINENAMLRKVLMNTRPKLDERNDPKQDQLSNS